MCAVAQKFPRLSPPTIYTYIIAQARALNTRMMRTVYYLVHWESMTRLKYYTTRAGARIAMRQRNHRLGFLTRINRIDNDPFEYELCVTTDGLELTGTYSILEDTIDTVDIIDHGTRADVEGSNTSNSNDNSSNSSNDSNSNDQHAGG